MSVSPSDVVAKPDLALGIAASSVPDGGVFAGRVGEEPVLLARVDGAVVAVGGACSHYGGPLHEGLRVGDTINCPWHHACFDLRTGAALKAPALSPLDRWKVDEEDGQIFLREKLIPVHVSAITSDPHPDQAKTSIVIVGGGAAGFAAAQRLRELGFQGELTMLSADQDAPYDRPNVSKDYLSGGAELSWMPLKDEGFYRRNAIYAPAPRWRRSTRLLTR